MAFYLMLWMAFIPEPCPAQSSPTDLTPQTLDKALEGLKSRNTRRIPFQETRRIPSLKTPMEFKGYLDFLLPDTLIKTVEKPMPATYILSSSEIRMTDGSTGESQSLRPDAIPELAYIGSSLVSLLSGDKAALLARWHVNLGGTIHHWAMSLVPLNQDSSGLRLVRIEGHDGDLQKLYFEGLDGSISTLALGAP
jgi:hypothetical protein